MIGISKRFGPVRVLYDVDFDVSSGEVHVLAGENGAGKSTLVRILAGVLADYQGQIEVGGEPLRARSPHDAERAGVAMIHQELALVPTMSVADNLFLGAWPTRGGLVRAGAVRAAAAGILSRFDLRAHPDELVGDLPLATRQLLEIARALSRDARLIVMDEPTSALRGPEADRLFAAIGDLKAAGCGVVYITHRLEEITRLADRVTVLRDGRRVASADASDVTPRRLIHWMIGRELDEQFPGRQAGPGPVRLRLDSFTIGGRSGQRPLVDGASLEVRAGEVLGLAGLAGSGASELMLGLFGALGPVARGVVALDGRPIQVRSPRQAVAHGIALLTNDRKTTGLVLSMSIIANAMLADLDRISPGGWLRPARERRLTAGLAEQLRLRAASLDMEVAALSGGNQQKVALAKWLQTEPRLLLLDEPTRGVDIGARREIYRLLNQWTAEGIAVILVSSELPELLALSDRIVVLHRGRVTARYEKSEASPDRVLHAALGETQPQDA